KMRTPDQIAEKSESSIKSQGMIPPWGLLVSQGLPLVNGTHKSIIPIDAKIMGVDIDSIASDATHCNCIINDEEIFCEAEPNCH
uniref:hypothetical protein n=1 Tax=Aeromonas caviae TaxID=648 RepID=UPI002B46B52F